MLCCDVSEMLVRNSIPDTPASLSFICTFHYHFDGVVLRGPYPYCTRNEEFGLLHYPVVFSCFPNFILISCNISSCGLSLNEWDSFVSLMLKLMKKFVSLTRLSEYQHSIWWSIQIYVNTFCNKSFIMQQEYERNTKCIMETKQNKIVTELENNSRCMK